MVRHPTKQVNAVVNNERCGQAPTKQVNAVLINNVKVKSPMATSPLSKENSTTTVFGVKYQLFAVMLLK